MARTHEPARQQPWIEGGALQPLIAFPAEDGGAIYFTRVEDARAAITDEMIEEALGLAGAWSDLADRDVEGELDRMRHESPPTPPIAE